jgi:Transposase IS116/IS110/IS902 family
VLAELARGRLRVKRAALVEALTGQFSDHHARLARILLDQIDGLAAQLDQLTTLIEEAIAAIPAAQAPAGRPDPGPTSGAGAPAQGPLPAMQRLDEVPGIGSKAAQVIIAELGLDMGQFPTPGHLVSWAKIAPQTIQSGAKRRAGPTGKGNPYLRGTLGEVAAAAAKTDTFLGERYRRLVRRRGKLKALVAIARSILVIVWHLLADPTARFRDLGADYHTSRIDTGRKTAAWSVNSKPSATPSACNPPHSPDRRRADPHPTATHNPAPLRSAGCYRLPLRRSFSGQGVRRSKSVLLDGAHGRTAAGELLTTRCGRLPLGLRRRLESNPPPSGAGTYGRNCWAILVTWPCSTVIQNGAVPLFGK